MSLKRRQFVQSAALLPLMAALPELAQAQNLALGVNANIVGYTQYVGTPQNAYFNLAMEYLYTNYATGVAIDIVPQAAAGGHAGVCFHAAPNSFGQWQLLSPGPGQPATQEFWYEGVGVIFQSDGRIQSEQWVVGSDGKPTATNVANVGTFPANTVLRVTSTTSYFGGTTIAVYSLNSAGSVVAQLANFSLTVSRKTDRVGVFVIGGGNIQVQPYALYP